MSTGEQRPRRKGRPSTPPVGRVRCADGVERDVYEDAGGRQYVLGEQGEKVFGLWPVMLSARSTTPPDEGTPPAEEGTQTSTNVEAVGASGETPWDEQGAVRLDRESHRGRMLALLGTMSFCLGVMAILTGVLGVPSLGFGLYVRIAARRDLGKMSTGEMDPAGQPQAQAALQDAYLGIGLSGLGLLIWSVAAVVLFFLFT